MSYQLHKYILNKIFNYFYLAFKIYKINIVYKNPNITIYIGVAIRVRKSGSCHVESWVFGYMSWPKLDMFNKHIRNLQPKHNLFIKQIKPTRHV